MKITRKDFIKKAISGVLLLELIYILKGSFSLKKDSDQKELFEVGKLASFQNGRTYPFTSGKFYLKRFLDGGFLALSTKCTHLGCMINTDAETGGFICPCHSSQFDQYGAVTSSPAARPLDTYPIIEKDGVLFVDLNKAIKRQSFDKSQLIYV